MSDNSSGDSEASFAATAGRQLFVFTIAAFVFIGALMWGLQGLASIVGSSTVTAKAVDFEQNSITIAIREEPPQLNTTMATDSSSIMILGHTMEGLLRTDANDKLEAGIAHRWEVTDTLATFWLREDIKWSDGSPITAHDFVFSWRTALDPEVVSEYSFLLYSIKNGRDINEGKLPGEALGARADGDHKLVVELERPVAFFDKMVAFVTFLPVQEKFYKSRNGRYGADADDMISSGPYIVTQWVHGSNLILKKNPHYWDRDRIHIETINIAYITSDATATLNFFKDDKIAFTTLLTENLDNALEERWKIFREQDGTSFFLEFNHRPGRLTDNLNLRRAMQLSLDMEELVYKVTKQPGYIPGKSLFPQFLMGVETNFYKEYPPPALKLDLEKARHHLALAKQELGIDEWPPLMMLTGDNPIANIQSEWTQAALKRHLGLDIRLDKQIFKQRLAKMTVGDFDMVLAGWGPDYDDPLTFGDLFASWNLNNRGRYNNPEMDRLIIHAQNSILARERMDTFGEIQQLIFDDSVILPMYERGVTFVVHPQLKDMKLRVIGPQYDFTNAYLVDEAGLVRDSSS
ncbi:MAG: oligopeptide transport system substrate-binding protein [Candidatus Azotimanducaceae bacterium]|jgi:oligopeptide transport system substrate-binding protein